jgi:putative transposase
MPRRPRSSSPARFHHVINRSASRVPLFIRPRDYHGFLAILREGLTRFPTPIVAYCILPNHWHLVMGPTGTNRLSQLFHWVTTTHAVRLRRREQTVGQGPVYQGRFKSHPIEASGNLVRVCRYVERNALAAGLVQRAQDWPWGSLADRRQAHSILPLTGAPFLGSDSWVEFVNATATCDGRPVPATGESVENRPVPLRDVAETPGPGVERRDQGIGVLGPADEHDPHAHVERPKHLGIRQVTGTLKPREDRRYDPALAIN